MTPNPHIPNDTSSAVARMNELGSQRVPFLFIIDYAMELPNVIPIREVDENEILFDINGFTNASGAQHRKKASLFHKHPVRYADYLRSFEIVQEHLYRGDSYLVNLTFPTPIRTDLSLREIFFSSSSKYRLLYRNQFVVFSPETFIRIDGVTISSYPMKGTIDASADNAEAVILADEKEMAEHTTIVDLIRNDLSMISGDVRLERFRYIDRIRTIGKDLLQVSSEISGQLPENYQNEIGTILWKVLPAGSVTGAPKKRTLEIISEAETYKRGYYSGVFGYFDGQRLESGVMIRFIEKTQTGLIYKSGGGITVYSDPRKEYQEMIDKVYVPAF